LVALTIGEDLSAELDRPEDAVAIVVLAHGAGAGYRHAGMESIAAAFGAAGLATLRFNFPFMQAGRRRVDPQPVAVAAISEAVSEAQRLLPDLPLFLGGHSFGGRMASHAVLELTAPVRGLIFCAFPLHPAGKPGVARAVHLARLQQPMLFLSGDRDALASPDLLAATVGSLGSRAELHTLATADHSYRIMKRQRADDVFEEMGNAAADFVHRCLARK